MKDEQYLTPVEAEHAEIVGGFAFILVLCEIVVLFLVDASTYRSHLSSALKDMTQWLTSFNWQSNRVVHC